MHISSENAHYLCGKAKYEAKTDTMHLWNFVLAIRRTFPKATGMKKNCTFVRKTGISRKGIKRKQVQV